jgi:restriction endonuclease S subunit
LQEQIFSFENGSSREGLNFQQVRSLLLALPPDTEQVAIADFLDRETAKIDRLVAKKRTLIERLKEKRTALISRTVTRGLPPDAARAAGLDPHPKLKPSGIDWLGDVPGIGDNKDEPGMQFDSRWDAQPSRTSGRHSPATQRSQRPGRQVRHAGR